MDLKRRIAKLEGRLNSDPVILQFADRSIALIPSRAGRDYVLDLFARAVTGDRSGEVDMIARSVSVDEPGGSKLCELIRAVANSPAEQAVRFWFNFRSSSRWFWRLFSAPLMAPVVTRRINPDQCFCQCFGSRDSR